MNRSLVTAIVVVIVALILVMCAVIGPQVGGASTPTGSPSPSVSPSPTATPTPPASSATVAKARKARRQALATWEKNRRIRKCFLLKQRALPPRLPLRSASEAAWLRALEKQVAKTASYRGENAERRHKMTHPGGTSNGVRWMPLARWVGWPEYTLSNLAYVIMRESSGRARALNPSSGCAGLLQIHPCHGVANPFDPEVNLRFGLRLYRSVGWSPWAL